MEQLEMNYPDMVIPPFWGNSDLLVFPDEETNIRALYCYFPIFREGGKLILVDPYEPTKVILEIKVSKELEELALRFRPEGDMIAIASAMNEDYSALKTEKASKVILKELQKGLSFPAERGEILNLSEYTLFSKDEFTTLETLMAIEDRLGIDETVPVESFATFIFVHNSRSK